VLARGVAPDAAGLDGVGYREVVAMLANGTRLPAPELCEAIAAATRSYAKRQETWFRNQLRGGVGRGEWDAPVWTLDAMEEPAVLAKLILDRWNAATAPHAPRPTPLP